MKLVGKLDFHSGEYTGQSRWDRSVRGYSPVRPAFSDSRDEVSSWLQENSLEAGGGRYTLFDEGVLCKIGVEPSCLTEPRTENGAPFKYVRKIHVEFSPQSRGIPSSLKNILNNLGYRLKDDSEPIPSL